jgi:hypothetical protein
VPSAPSNCTDESVQFLLKIDESKGQQCPGRERGTTLLLCPSSRTDSSGVNVGSSFRCGGAGRRCGIELLACGGAGRQAHVKLQAWTSRALGAPLSFRHAWMSWAPVTAMVALQ